MERLIVDEDHDVTSDATYVIQNVSAEFGERIAGGVDSRQNRRPFHLDRCAVDMPLKV